MVKKKQYEEELRKETETATGKDGNDGGLREVTYRPPVHSKSTTCLGGCSERRGSAVSISNTKDNVEKYNIHKMRIEN